MGRVAAERQAADEDYILSSTSSTDNDDDDGHGGGGDVDCGGGGAGGRGAEGAEAGDAAAFFHRAPKALSKAEAKAHAAVLEALHAMVSCVADAGPVDAEAASVEGGGEGRADGGGSGGGSSSSSSSSGGSGGGGGGVPGPADPALGFGASAAFRLWLDRHPVYDRCAPPLDRAKLRGVRWVPAARRFEAVLRFGAATAAGTATAAGAAAAAAGSTGKVVSLGFFDDPLAASAA